jgi:HTH-type transcriptional regulator/antitoxin HipB
LSVFRQRNTFQIFVIRTELDHPAGAVRAAGQLGPALKALRQAHGWSQTELGRRVGLSQERISTIERQPERVTVGQLLTVLMALDAQLRVERRSRAPAPEPW